MVHSQDTVYIILYFHYNIHHSHLISTTDVFSSLCSSAVGVEKLTDYQHLIIFRMLEPLTLYYEETFNEELNDK